MRFVQHAGVFDEGVSLVACATTVRSYNISNDTLELPTIVFIPTQEMERLSLSKYLAAQIAVGVDAVFDAHAKATEHECDDAVDVSINLFCLTRFRLRSHLPSSARAKHEAEIMTSKR